jgi:hypothetical protein
VLVLGAALSAPKRCVVKGCHLDFELKGKDLKAVTAVGDQVERKGSESSTGNGSW